MKKISLLGSTGSIGVNTLDVVERYPEKFQVCALSTGSNVELFANQIRKFKPALAALYDSTKVDVLKELVGDLDVEIVSGQEGTISIASFPDADMVVSGVVGSAGLLPAIAAIKAGKNLALANKETLVIAGELVLKEAARNNTQIIPIDSEHSAIFQALNGEKTERIKKIILTASGGPFRNFTLKQMESVTVKDALNHPNWSMGAKITIDSSTMMNKGLEYIEAKWLFGTEIPVEIIVHAQSIIHSMIEFVDTSIIAQMGIPDMRVPITYALTYPDRYESDLPSLDLSSIGNLTFEAPDFDRFPCLKLAMDAIETGQTIPAVLNAANEIAVRAFLDELITYKDISEIIRMVMYNHRPVPLQEMQDVLDADLWAREETTKLITVAH
ncbi:MAG TPA: 1-deoxy-D-xylulose-5-phosphate reductoisomerase [Nitrospinaceae bacterium]|jgi:1-deoxy-D-xylulose-5-phosphate reductoisomerase|nr:1-deoxy-D-xylulose-5-phosphate reductoisomerase [Nitrospinaceae bacterium]HIK58303.1 1-deoxy-D-xylulose-5-phosphate reductoisomerase [Nitrospinaceae bacterium]